MKHPGKAQEVEMTSHRRHMEKKDIFQKARLRTSERSNIQA